MRTSFISLFSIVVSIVSVVIVVPLGILHHSGIIREEMHGREEALAEITTRQVSLLEELGKLQTKVFAVQATIESLTSKDGGEDQEQILEAKKLVLKKEFATYSEKLDKQLLTLEKETKTMFRDLKDMVDAHANRFIVKWHGDKGIKASKRMATEQEAVDKFNDIGDLAKKLLLFDGSKWNVVKEFGGQNWLEMLKNDGNAPDEVIEEGKAEEG